MLAAEEARTPWRNRETSSSVKPGVLQPLDSPVPAPIEEEDDLRALLEQQLPVIEQIIRGAVRRHTMRREDAEEFDARVKLHLLEDECAVLRKWRRDAQLSTYLTVVINRLLLDFRVEMWGRWRSSSKAKRLGADAVCLEALMVRDGFNLDEAIEILRSRRISTASRGTLIELAERLPARCPRTFVDESKLQSLESPDRTELLAEEAEKARLAAQVRTVFAEALAQLRDEDRVLLQLYYDEGMPLKEIAVFLQISQRSIYSRHEQCLRSLRLHFTSAGLSWALVESIVGWEGTEMKMEFRSECSVQCSGHGGA